VVSVTIALHAMLISTFLVSLGEFLAGGGVATSGPSGGMCVRLGFRVSWWPYTWWMLM